MAKESIFEEVGRLETKREELENQKNAIDERISSLKSTINTHAAFDVNLIGEALAELITAVSGRKFVYKKVTNRHFFSRWVTEGRQYGHITEDQHIVVASEKYKEKYDSEESDEVEQLVKDGDAISLTTWGSDDNLTTIYPWYPWSAFNSLQIDFEKFGYVKDFAKSLIGYCILKGINYYVAEIVNGATKDDINECLIEFLENYKKEHAPKEPTLEKAKGENK